MACHQLRDDLLHAFCAAEGPGEESARKALEMAWLKPIAWLGVHERGGRHAGGEDVQRQ